MRDNRTVAQAHNEIATSFQIIDFARQLDLPLTPWQEALIIRHGEARYAQCESQQHHRGRRP